MEYNIVVAPNLEVLATEVAEYFPMGWRLKGGILEHNAGYAQQLVRNPSDRLRSMNQPQPAAKRRRTKWIEV